MRRRRRSNNPLLAKTLLVGIGAAIIILPILAQFGLFKQLHEAYVQTQLVSLPPPPPQPKEQKPRAKKAVKSHVHSIAHRGQAPRATKAPTVAVHVAASKGSGGSTEPAIVNKAPGGPVGVVPTGPPIAPTPPPVPPAPPPPAPLQAIAPPAAPAPEPPAQPVLVEAEPVDEPKPVLPDDLLDSDIDTTFYGYFTIHADGTVDVKMVQSTGNSILDRLAIDAAKQWRFTPATKNGMPVDSYRRLQVEFEVS
jgi:periplasmic protein TonB